MGTRLYLSSSAAPLTPSSWSAAWDVDGTTNALLARGRRGNSSIVTQAFAGTGVSGQLKAAWRFISDELTAQTLSGTLKGIVHCYEANATDNFTVALAAKVIAPDGSDRGILLAPTATDDLTHEVTNGAVGLRKFRDASENTDIPFSTLAIQEGDRIVFEIGFRQASTSTANFTFQAFSGNIAFSTDLPYDETASLAGFGETPPWVEFSQDLKFLHPVFHGRSAVVPADNGTEAGPNITLVPPTMPKGTLVIAVLQSRPSGTWSVGVDGGQTWNALTAFQGTSNPFCRVFWCVFNGTWSASPRFDCSSSGTKSGFLTSFVPKTVNDTWIINVAQQTTQYAQPTAGSPGVSGPSITTTEDDCVALSAMFSSDDTDWTSLTSTTAQWQYMGSEFRNLDGTDQSLVAAYYFPAAITAGALGNLTGNQNAPRAAGCTWGAAWQNISGAQSTNFLAMF